MCEKCDELDNKIAHYRRLAGQITDKQTLDGIAGLIAEMATSRAAIHCEPKKE